MLRILAAAGVVLAIGSNAFAWNAGGHRTVARIAWLRLSPAERERVATLIRRNPRFDDDFRIPGSVQPKTEEAEVEWLFTQAAVWPDLMRDGPAEFDHPTWHYINHPLFLSEQDRTALQGTIRPNLWANLPKNAETADLNALQAIKLSLAKLNSPKTSAAEQGIAVCWLMHLVGDVHQPLHSTALFSRVAFPRGDQGGNQIPTSAGELHVFWDGLPGRSATFNDVRSRSVELLEPAESKKLGEQAAKQLDPAVWIDESHRLCRDHVYDAAVRDAVMRRELGDATKIPEVRLTEEYKTASGRIAARRMVEAGCRLAATLQQVVSGKDAPTTPPAPATLRIVGLLPDPAGEDPGREAIRLRNVSRARIDLAGWRLRDASDASLPLTGTIEPGATREIVDVENRLPLSNRSDAVELLDPQGQVVHRVRYDEQQVERGKFIGFE